MIPSELAGLEVSDCKPCSSDSECPGDPQGCNAVGYCSKCIEGIDSVCGSPELTQTKNTQSNCNVDSDCKTKGCICNVAAGNFCVPEKQLDEVIQECQTCKSNADCLFNRTGHVCDTKTKKCTSCTRTSTWISTYHCLFPSDLTVRQPPTNNPPSINPLSRNPGKGNVCISTEWLKERDLEHAAIRHAGVSKVLCVPGLPCGTAGHLLREYNNESSGSKLLTYREVCERRRDCIESATAVSQLSHTFDWSQFKSIGEGTTLELTSLSANPQSNPSSPSRLIARVGERLNSIGLGTICNAVALLPNRFHETFFRGLVTASVEYIVCFVLPRVGLSYT